jgi:elongation factor Ts
MIKDVATHIAQKKPGSPEVMLEQPFAKDPSKTVSQVLAETIATLGENMSLRRFALFEAQANGAVQTYIHGEGKVGVLLELGCGNVSPENEQLAQFGRDVCMHIAAAQPQYVQSSDVPAEIVAKEKEIAIAQMASQNKPQAVLEKIAEGKTKKFFDEICLINQPFVKNPDQTIDQLTKATGKALGTDLSIKRFTRFVLGDGLVAAAE